MFVNRKTALARLKRTANAAGLVMNDQSIFDPESGHGVDIGEALDGLADIYRQDGHRVSGFGKPLDFAQTLTVDDYNALRRRGAEPRMNIFAQRPSKFTEE